MDTQTDRIAIASNNQSNNAELNMLNIQIKSTLQAKINKLGSDEQTSNQIPNLSQRCHNCENLNVAVNAAHKEAGKWKLL